MKNSLNKVILGLSLCTGAQAAIHDEAIDHLQIIDQQMNLLIEVINSGASDMYRAGLIEEEKDEHIEKVLERSEEMMAMRMERIEALVNDRPDIDTGYEEAFMKSPVRVSDMGMLNAAILIPSLDTANTVGFGQWNLGVRYKSSYQHVVAPKRFNPGALFVDVNDLNFTGFGDVEWFGAVSGTMTKAEIYGVFGVTDFIDVGFNLPLIKTPEYVLYDAKNYHLYTAKLSDAQQMGDLEAWVKWRLFSTPKGHVKGAVKGEVRFPTGNKQEMTSLGVQQMSLSYVLSLQPYPELVANITSGLTYMEGESELFLRPVKLSSVAYFGAGVVHRFGENWALGFQYDSFTNPWREIPLDMFEEPVSMATTHLKFSKANILSEMSYSVGLNRASPESIFMLNLSTKETLRDEKL